MKKILLFAATIFTVLFLLLAANSTQPQTSKSIEQVSVEEPFDPGMSTVRLHTLTGQFFCSGVVVGKRTILTAAHCVSGNEGLIDVRNQNNQSVGALATVAGMVERADYAILRGDFHMFRAMVAITDPIKITKALKDKKRFVVTCGFPWSGDLFCSPLRNRRMFNFMFAGDGMLYPGMSGGPVIDLSNGTVIAVNSAVAGDMTLVSPIIEIYKACEVDPE